MVKRTLSARLPPNKQFVHTNHHHKVPVSRSLKTKDWYKFALRLFLHERCFVAASHIKHVKVPAIRAHVHDLANFQFFGNINMNYPEYTKYRRRSVLFSTISTFLIIYARAFIQSHAAFKSFIWVRYVNSGCSCYQWTQPARNWNMGKTPFIYSGFLFGACFLQR